MLAASRILVPWPVMDPAPPALEAWSVNHWTAREVPVEFNKEASPLRVYFTWRKGFLAQLCVFFFFLLQDICFTILSGFCYTSTWISHKCTYIHYRYTSEMLWILFQTTIIKQILQKKQVIWIFWFPSASQAPLLKDGENIYTCMTKSLASARVPWQE